VRQLLALITVLVLATAIGLGATHWAVTRGAAFGAVTIGAWNAWPKTGTTDIDPYARAALARSGELPLGSGDGVTFLARADDGGNALDGRCEIVVAGSTPPARSWTLTLYDPAGRLVANPASRHGFTSHEVMRQPNGNFEILVAPRARPGNWLPTAGVERYVLVLRLYDTPVGVTTRAGRDTEMPSISRKACP
jgi:hypothetical protein